MKCTRCHKSFPKTKTRGNYCSLLCKRITAESPERKLKRKGGKYIRSHVWSPLQGKSVHLRSSYELTYIKWLEAEGIPWIYEEFLFTVQGGKKYLPDFYLPETKEFVEVKGRFTKGGKEKYEAFKKLYPNEKIKLVQRKEIEDIRKSMNLESDGRRKK